MESGDAVDEEGDRHCGMTGWKWPWIVAYVVEEEGGDDVVEGVEG